MSNFSLVRGGHKKKWYRKKQSSILCLVNISIDIRKHNTVAKLNKLNDLITEIWGQKRKIHAVTNDQVKAFTAHKMKTKLTSKIRRIKLDIRY